MDIKEQVLTVEQAMHLQELGLDMSDAAHCWFKRTRDRYGNHTDGSWNIKVQSVMVGLLEKYEIIPTYTLQEVLDKLPKDIIRNDNIYCVDMHYDDYGGLYEVGYYTLGDTCLYFEGDTLLEKLYNMLCWVLENGYYK